MDPSEVRTAIYLDDILGHQVVIVLFDEEAELSYLEAYDVGALTLPGVPEIVKEGWRFLLKVDVVGADEGTVLFWLVDVVKKKLIEGAAGRHLVVVS